MKTLKQLKEERVEAENKIEALVKAAETGDLTADQKSQFDALEKEIENLDGEIKRAESIEARSKAIAKSKLVSEAAALPGAPQDDESEIKELNKISKRYSFAKSVQNIIKTKKLDALDGVEAEMFEEAQIEAKAANISLGGNIAIPSKFIQIGKRKLLSVTTEGTDAVYTEFGGLIPILRPDPILSQMGATFYTGLQGNVQWTRQNGDVALAFETESSDVDETTPTLDNISVDPHRFGGYLDVTNKFLIQAPWVVEPWLRAQLEARYALTIDTQGLTGTGSGNAPTGLLNYSGVNVVSLGNPNGGDMTYGALLEFIRSTKAAYARNGRAGWLTNADGEFALARTPFQSGGIEGNFIYKMDNKLIGRNFNTSQLIPSTLTEGTQSDLVGMIYSSRWESLIIALWGGMDLLFDPYTQALGGKKRFVVNAFMDVEVEQPLEFAISKDWDATDVPALT